MPDRDNDSTSTAGTGHRSSLLIDGDQTHLDQVVGRARNGHRSSGTAEPEVPVPPTPAAGSNGAGSNGAGHDGVPPEPGEQPAVPDDAPREPDAEAGDAAPAGAATEPPAPLERGATATYTWMPMGLAKPAAAEPVLPEPALAETALAEPTTAETAAAGPTVSETALAGTTLSEDAVTGPPVPDTDPGPPTIEQPSVVEAPERVSLVKPERVSLVKPVERVSLVKARETISHPRVAMDDPEPEPVAAPAPDRPTPTTPPARRRDQTLLSVSQVLGIVAALTLGFLTQLTLLGALQHERDQAQAFAELRIELAIGTAPVGPLGEDGNPLPAGTPVAILQIPRLGLDEVVLEGSTSRVLMSGPGHRRDTVLPGQTGTSVVLGRRAGYGGPFGDLDDLRQGDEIVVTTGQGRHTFAVTGVRRAGDPLPARLAQGQGRLTLVTADGPRFRPTDALRVDADLTSPAQLRPAQIPSNALPENEAVMAGDSAALLSLMLWGPLLLAAAVGTVWIRHRAGRWQAWIIGLPVLTLLGVIVIDTAAALLPNVL